MSTQRRHTSRQMLLLCFCLCLLCNFADAMLDTHHPGEASTAIESGIHLADLLLWFAERHWMRSASRMSFMLKRLVLGSPKDTPLNTARRHLNTEAASAVSSFHLGVRLDVVVFRSMQTTSAWLKKVFDFVSRQESLWIL